MQSRSEVALCAVALALVALQVRRGQAESGASPQARHIPVTWDDSALRTTQLPLANPAYSPVHVTSDYYYRMPVRPVYASYPVYAPGREPPGYLDSLRKLAPLVVFRLVDATNRSRLD